jgi:hypothetical protein
VGGVSGKVFVELKRPGLDQYHWWRDRAACRDAPYSMVDEAFQRSGGPSAHAFIKRFCEVCPVRQQCYDEAMETGEFGVWGGATQKTRTGRGAPKPFIGSAKV